MNKAVKAKWVAALRSDKIEQAQSALCTVTGEMCCLGVLRHVMNPRDTQHSVAGEWLNDRQLKKAGLTDDIQRQLGRMNDMVTGPSCLWTPVPFEVIAGFIEENL